MTAGPTDSRRAVFDAALDPIITIDHQGRVVEFNAAAEIEAFVEKATQPAHH